MSNRSAYAAAVHPGVSDIAAEAWDRLFPGEAEGHAYYRACEAAPPPAFRLGAVSVTHNGSVVAAAPFFRLDYRLDTPLQGRWRPLGDWLHRRLPRLVNVPLLCLGSPLVDRCHLGTDPHLSPAEATRAVGVLLEELAAHAGREGAEVLAVKDIAAPAAGRADEALKEAGYTRVKSLPVAKLTLAGKDEEAYLASLSAATRKDIRRKLRGTSGVDVEITRSIAGLEGELNALYRSTIAESGVDYGEFEELSPDYFAAIMREMGEGAVFVLYRVSGELVAFNLLLIRGQQAIDKVLGMRYPIAREKNLYVVSWMTNVRLCLARGIRELETGRTAYTSKVRYGSHLEPCWVYFRHRRRVINRLFRTFGPMLAFDKLDPELKALEARGRLAGTATPKA